MSLYVPLPWPVSFALSSVCVLNSQARVNMLLGGDPAICAVCSPIQAKNQHTISRVHGRRVQKTQTKGQLRCAIYIIFVVLLTLTKFCTFSVLVRGDKIVMAYYCPSAGKLDPLVRGNGPYPLL